jgi:prepilin-type N-terminal cleavage/methylation domain-containing protein
MTMLRRTARRRLGGPDTRRGGFSLIELLMAVSIVGILAGLAIPNLRSMTFRARAAEVAADLEVVRVAALNYNADTFDWPADAAQGVVPPELNGFLPEGFSFQGNGYELKYEHFNLPGGLPGDPGTMQLIAVSATVDGQELSNAVVELLGGSLIFSVGTKHTVVIDRS